MSMMNAVVAPDAEGLFSVSEPLSFLLKLRAALASQIKWSETIISWHVLFFSTPSLFLPFTHEAYDALITTTSQKSKTISQDHHDSLYLRNVASCNTKMGSESSFRVEHCFSVEMLPTALERLQL